MHKFFPVIILLTCCVTLFGQTPELYHRARISLLDKDISSLSLLGIETDHGKHALRRFFENDFSEKEIEMIKSEGFNVEILIEDVVSYYQNPNRPSELDKLYSRSGDCGDTESCQVGDYPVPQYYSGGSMGGYKTYSQLLANVDSMALLYPNLVTKRTTISEDTTHDGNQIFYLKISDNPSEEETSEPQVLYTALHHAREPNSLSQMLYYMWYLLENYETDDEIKNIVDNTELYFVPCLNPDGYIINEINNPDGGGLWRKNARKTETGELFGVDLNRNYGYFWGFDDNGSSPNPNSETYRGETAFSEPETMIIKEFCEANNFLIALNYHTHGDLLIYPWGYSDAPTDENTIFRGLGNEMINENCYTMGTGTETVGYVVNGDSDDWMYGETTTKNKIYSMTPEVGPSFWPPQQDIIALNKSCMAMNLKAAQLVSNLYEMNTLTNGPLFSTNNSIDIIFQKIGLGQGPVDIAIEATSLNIDASMVTNSLDIGTGSSTVVPFPFSYNPSIQNGEEITINVTIRGNGYTKEKRFAFTYYENGKESILTDATEDAILWESNGDWGLTDEYVNEGSFSLADSPNSEYRRNATTRTILKDPIDLTEAIYAEIQFDARWEIETGYDYAMVTASTDGVNFTPLCGNYTTIGNDNQELDQPLYDGFQTEWVEETVSLIDYIGQPKVYIQFLMASDQFVEEEGIYIDDIRVNRITETPSSTDHTINVPISIYPNPAVNELVISGSIKTDYRVSIKAITGELLYSGLNPQRINISTFPKGVYVAEIGVEGNFYTKKFVKI